MSDSKSERDPVPEALEVCGFSDRGCIRSNNEDYFGFYVPTEDDLKERRGGLFAVSDGVGGSAAGDAASAEAVNVLLQEYYFGRHTEKAPERLKFAFQKTASHIYDLAASHASARNMKCTLTTLLVKQEYFFVSHIGDSKILLIRDGRILQLTKDHNMVGKLLRLGLITAEDARTHPDRNILLKAVGESPLLLPDFSSGSVKPGDLFCLVTDGVSEHATHDELKEFLLEKGHSEDGLTELIAELKRRGGYDNMTIVTVKINRLPW